MPNVVEVDRLSKRYGERAAVDELTFHVEAGEVVALLGPNGAGKSTTIEILEGFRSRSAGTVRVLGLDPQDATRAWRARIGIVSQESSLTGECTAGELVRHYASFYPDPRPAEEVLELVGLADQADQRSTALSGGQLRRLEVGIGVVGRPELLFLDEPTTGFDPEARRQFWELIGMLADGGTTVLLTTHYLDEAEALAGRAVVIADGRIVAEGPPATIGGRSTFAAVVHWADQDGEHRQETDTPTALVAELSARLGGEVPALTVTRPSLEDTYLRLIGEHR